jgi:extracellular elastinolytic metalloproteinase
MSIPVELLLTISFSVIELRNAWIFADEKRYRGDHKQILWRAFASRGLGVEAAEYVDSYVVPQS